MRRRISLLFATVLIVVGPAARVSALCLEFGRPGSRDYWITPASLLSLAGSPDEVPAGSLTLENHDFCDCDGVGGGFWAYGVQFELVTERVHWTMSSDLGFVLKKDMQCPLFTGATTSGVSGAVSQWTIGGDDGTSLLHQIAIETAPVAAVVLDWSNPAEGLPGAIDFGALVHEVVYRCSPSDGCNIESDTDLGTLRLVASAPEPAACWTALVALVALAGARHSFGASKTPAQSAVGAHAA